MIKFKFVLCDYLKQRVLEKKRIRDNPKNIPTPTVVNTSKGDVYIRGQYKRVEVPAGAAHPHSPGTEVQTHPATGKKYEWSGTDKLKKLFKTMPHHDEVKLRMNMKRLEMNPNDPTVPIKRMAGELGGMKTPLYRLKQDKWRVVFTKTAEGFQVVAGGSRNDVYRHNVINAVQH